MKKDHIQNIHDSIEAYKEKVLRDKQDNNKECQTDAQLLKQYFETFRFTTGKINKANATAKNMAGLKLS